jgi:hypothetical protein
MQKVNRYIAYFDKKKPRYLVGRFPLPDDCLDTLREIFSPPPDDPLMYDYYEVDKKAAAILSSQYGLEFLLREYDYAVGAEAA